ncbi:MAG: HCO3- transporter, partial [Proteobacteria bacterium]|nr:HCO3- transporter [Pseudomonadota bacterium]
MFSGLRSDVAIRIPHYMSDFTDAMHRKVVSSTFYLFFACLANAIAFGALSGFLTHGEIGTIEMIVATAIGGISYALFSAQPITLLGGTGPIVIFTALLYQACTVLEIAFITTYAWVGIWAGAILLVLSITNASNWMRYFSRFTDDIFAALVSIIFIVEAVGNLWAGIREPGQGSDTRVMIAVLALGTFAIAIVFAMIGRSERLYHLPLIRTHVPNPGFRWTLWS